MVEGDTVNSCDLFSYGFFKTSEKNIFGGGNKTNNYVLLQEAQQDLLKQADNTKIHDQATINPELTYDKLLRQKYAEFLIFFVSEDLLIARKDQEEESLKLLATYGDSFNAFKTMFLERKSEVLLQNNTLNYNSGDVLRFLCLSEDKELKAKTMKKFMMEFLHIRKIKTLGTNLEYSKTLQDEFIKAMCLKFKFEEFNKFSDDYSKLITILDEMNLPSDGNLHSEFPKFINQVFLNDSISNEFKERIAHRANDSWDLKYELKNYFKDPKIMKLDIQQLILDMQDRKSDFRSNTSERMKHLKDYLKTRPDMKISFKEFMNESLFGSHGYYSENDMTSSENKLIGTGGLNKGDFSTFTSSQPFCKMVAQEYFAFKQKNPNSVLVLGSDGVGSLRNNLQKLGVEPNEIFTIDISPTLLKEQMKLSQSFGGENPEGNFIEGSAFDKASFDKIRQQFSVDNEPAIFIMANELMDVQPMNYFTLKVNDDNSFQVKELYIRLDKNDQIISEFIDIDLSENLKVKDFFESMLNTVNIKDSMKNKEIPLALNLEEENLWNKWLDLDFEKIKILNIDYAKKFENMMTAGNEIRFFPSFISDVKDIKKIHEAFEALDITADINIDAFWSALKNHPLAYKGDVKLQLDMVLEAQQNSRDIDISPIANDESFEAMMKRYSFNGDSFWAMIAEKK